MSGEDIRTGASLFGHKDLRMAARHQQLSPDYLTAAVNKLDAVWTPQRHQQFTAGDR